MDNTRKRLIFFTNSHPHSDPKPARNAYHLAVSGRKAGLETEVRLAGDGVFVTQLSQVPDTEAGLELKRKVQEARELGVLVSL